MQGSLLMAVRRSWDPLGHHAQDSAVPRVSPIRTSSTSGNRISGAATLVPRRTSLWPGTADRDRFDASDGNIDVER